MATAKTNLGKMPCPACGDPVAVMRADTGTLSYKCQDAGCEMSAFAQVHTGAARRWLAKLPAGAVPVVAPVVAPVIKPIKKTPPVAAFDLGAL